MARGAARHKVPSPGRAVDPKCPGRGAARRRPGFVVRGKRGSQIAAIARTRGAAVELRDLADFTGRGMVVINPWTDTRH